MLCLSGFELYSRWVSLYFETCANGHILSLGHLWLQSGTKVVDTLVWNGCFCQTFNSSIISFRLNAINPLTPRINVV